MCILCYFRAAFKYEGHMIVPAGQGTDYEEFKSQCTGKARISFIFAPMRLFQIDHNVPA